MRYGDEVLEELSGSVQGLVSPCQSSLKSGLAEVQVAVESCGGVFGDLLDESVDEIDDAALGVAKEVDDGHFGLLRGESGGKGCQPGLSQYADPKIWTKTEGMFPKTDWVMWNLHGEFQQKHKTSEIPLMRGNDGSGIDG